MSFEQFTIEDRRLVILRALNKETDRRLNEALLERYLDRFGHRVTRDQVRETLDWLSEVRAVKVSRVGDNEIYIAELLERGEDHVSGKTTINGIARPRAQRD